jgi:hypothetical protein
VASSWRRVHQGQAALAVRGQTGTPLGRTCLKACPQASQPPDHDGRDVGNYAHHCDDHGLIAAPPCRPTEARGLSCRALFDCVWIECDDMELSLSPCCRGVLYQTISQLRDGKKARKWNALGHTGMNLGENGSIYPRPKGRGR